MCNRVHVVDSVDKVEDIGELSQLIDEMKQGPYADKRLSDLFYSSNVFGCLRFCLVDPTKEVRALAYRMLRQLIHDKLSLSHFANMHLDVFLIRTLVRDSRFDTEREQALRFVRRFLEHPEGPDLLPLPVVRVLSALCEQLDDRFRVIAVETLCEVALLNPKLACFANSLKPLFLGILDGPDFLLEPIVSTFLCLLDHPQHRVYLRPDVEIESVICSFMEAYTSKGSYSVEKLDTASQVMYALFSSWTGLFVLCRNKKQSVRSLVDALSFPDGEIRIVLLNLISKILIPEHGSRISNHHRALFLMTLIDCRLVEALVHLIKENHKVVLPKAIDLLTWVLAFAEEELEKRYMEQVEALSVLFQIASDFHNESERQFARDKFVKLLDTVILYHKPRSSHLSPLDGIDNNMRARVAFHLDDMTFRNMINSSEVLGLKEHPKWNWDIIFDIVSGPMLNPKRFEELYRGRFMAKLIHYIRPSSHQFSDEKLQDGSRKVTVTCCTFVQMLLGSTEGFRILFESKLIAEIGECLGQLVDPVLGALNQDLIFSKARMAETRTRDYFAILGVLTQSADGLKLLELARVFSVFYQLLDLRGRDDIVKALISSMHYELEGHPRFILSKVMVSGYKEIRLFATEQLGRSLKRSKKRNEWGIRSLIPQLYDPSVEVSNAALQVLTWQMENNDEFIHEFIAYQPDLEHLSTVANTLLLRLMNVPAGLEYLMDQEYLEDEFDYWFEHGVFQYIPAVEQHLENNSTAAISEKNLPAHFYNHFSKTKEGCELLDTSGHLAVFLEILGHFQELEQSLDGVIKIKAALWSIAHIGSNKYGFQLIARANAVQLMVKIARESGVLSVRGSCIISMSLICTHEEGRETVEALGWHVGKTVCIPKDLEPVFHIGEWDYQGSWPIAETKTFMPYKGKMDAVDEEILQAIGNLSNHIVASTASKRLASIRQENAAYFTKPWLFLLALRITAVYNFKIATRRFVADLFEKVVWDKTALETIDQLEGLSLCFQQSTAREASIDDIPEQPTITIPEKVDRSVLVSKRVVRGFPA
ncbi:Rapamycin-insensitive companion of mTOR, N-term-domain-containing protein [Gorgonomyces haynaldii]|nr:Rapamycin-insensitive companion of mTOR, N-term-domain-containing protein [Gorgonomyces haynaldii]